MSQKSLLHCFAFPMSMFGRKRGKSRSPNRWTPTGQFVLTRWFTCYQTFCLLGNTADVKPWHWRSGDSQVSCYIIQTKRPGVHLHALIMSVSLVFGTVGFTVMPFPTSIQKKSGIVLNSIFLYFTENCLPKKNADCNWIQSHVNVVSLVSCQWGQCAAS